ncbi:MAG: hypothetical protein EBU81_06330, partial [Proteobacteria bacterium]|nr:hypothetical protein [Pseudomonadota bacterium]
MMNSSRFRWIAAIGALLVAAFLLLRWATERDKERVAKRLRMKSAELEARYLRLDEDGDWVLLQLPCPFLEAD